MKNLLLLAKKTMNSAWVLLDESFYDLDSARQHTRLLIDAGHYEIVAIGECDSQNDVPVFNLIYSAKNI